MSVSQLRVAKVSAAGAFVRRSEVGRTSYRLPRRLPVSRYQIRSALQHCVVQPRGRSLWQGSGSRRSASVFARNPKAVYDDEDWDEQAEQGGGLVSGLFGAAFSAVSNVTDILMDVAPDNIPRSVVDLSVKAGMVLIVIGFARSLLSFVLTIGTLVLGLYVAYQLFGGGGNSGKGFDGGRRGGRRGGSRGGALRLPPTLPLPLPVSRVEDDLMDIWFEPLPKQQRQRQLRQPPRRGQRKPRRLPDRREKPPW